MEELSFWNGLGHPCRASDTRGEFATRDKENVDKLRRFETGKAKTAGGKYERYCGNCLMPVTRSPVKRTKTVFDGGWP